MKNFSVITKAIYNPKWVAGKIKIKLDVKKYKKLNYQTHKVFLDNIIKSNTEDFITIINEIINDYRFNDFINLQFKSTGLKKRFPGARYSWPIFLYYFTRKTKPAIIVETECWYGISSSYILAAINKNNFGKLYTINLPTYPEKGGYIDENPYSPEEDRTASLPFGKEPGFIIPTFLKNNWELILGSSKEELPKLLNKLGIIDMFLHDSLHSYENMMFEFDIVLRFLKKGGYIFSDNIDWNSAFKDFTEKLLQKKYTYLAYYESPQLNHNFGVIIKE